MALARSRLLLRPGLMPLVSLVPRSADPAAAGNRPLAVCGRPFDLRMGGGSSLSPQVGWRRSPQGWSMPRSPAGPRAFGTSSSSSSSSSRPSSGSASGSSCSETSDSELSSDDIASGSSHAGSLRVEDPESSEPEAEEGLNLHRRYVLPERGGADEQEPDAAEEEEASDSELEDGQEESEMDLSLGPADVEVESMSPKRMVEQLDRFIIGQADAKKSIAVAVRNRWRRQRLDPSMKDFVTPRNVLMVGPTGVGKTEIARQVAKLLNCPFVRVEATKFTEVGYYGQDVDTIIRDLVLQSLQMVKEFQRKRCEAKIQRQVEETIIDALLGKSFGPAYRRRRKTFTKFLREGQLEQQEITIEVAPPPPSQDPGFMLGGKVAFLMDFPGSGNKKTESKRMTIAQARPILAEQAGEKLFNAADAEKHAIKFAEQHGIVFIDEIDKIVRNPNEIRTSGDASAEGVQRDLLPLVEGSTTQISFTRGGPTHPVRTDHILFIASGAFHGVAVKDMLPELQGRLPVRVDMKPLTRHDLFRILTEPENSLLKQAEALFATEGVQLKFTDDAVQFLADCAHELNRFVENLGARRLHGIVEQVTAELSYEASERAGEVLVVDRELIEARLAEMRKRSDLSQMVI